MTHENQFYKILYESIPQNKQLFSVVLWKIINIKIPNTFIELFLWKLDFMSLYCKLVKVQMLCILCNN